MRENVTPPKKEPVLGPHISSDQDREQSNLTQVSQILLEMKALAQQIAAAWISPKSGVELIVEQRR